MINSSFHAIILDEKDPQNKGRYKVYIPELAPLLTDDSGIWVKNQIHKYRDNTGSGKGRYGQYFPLHPGTHVLVVFYNINDLNSGYVDRIIDDDIPNPDTTKELSDNEPIQNQFKIPLPFDSDKDRDEFYQLIRTPKYDNIIAISEDSAGDIIPTSNIFIGYKKFRSSFTLNDDGIHLETEDSFQDYCYKDRMSFTKADSYNFINGNSENIYNQKLNEFIVNGLSTLVLYNGRRCESRLGDITDYAKYANIVRYSGLSSIDINQNFVVISKKRIYLEAGDEINIVTDKGVAVTTSNGKAIFRIQSDGTVRINGNLLVSGEIVASSITKAKPSNDNYSMSTISDDSLHINNDDLKKFYKENMINIDMLYPDGDEEKPITDEQIDEKLSVYEKDMVPNVLVTTVVENKGADSYLNQLLSVKPPRVNLPAPTRKIKLET
jgi:hypothetical protein